MWKSKVFVLVAVAFVCSLAGIPNAEHPNYSNEPCDSASEELSNCANAVCAHQFCSERTLTIGCPGVTECDKGCICKPDYYRDVNGICVPENQCSIGPQCGENEEYTPCEPRVCRPQICGEIASPCNPANVKDENCYANCVCKENYARRNLFSPCMPISEC